MAALGPELSVILSLSSTTYSFSKPTPPTLALTTESLADRPITLFTWNTPFNPASGMTQGCFPIVDTDHHEPVPQTTIRLQRPPFSRARGSGDEQYFLTLRPHVPAVVSTGFGRGEGTRPSRKWLWSEDGNSTSKAVR